MSWTDFTRRDYARRSGRYASDLTDREWGLICDFMPVPRLLIVAHRHHETICKDCSGSAAERQTKMVDDRLEPLGPPAIPSQNAGIELFAENSPTAQDSIAPKSERHDRQFYSTATKGQVRGPAQIAALNASALSSAVRTSPQRWTRSQKDMHAPWGNLD